MCGIVGQAGALSLDDERLFKVMLLLDYFRGQDSTGIATVKKKDNSVSVLKVADDPIILMQHSDFEQTMHGGLDVIQIGHNRASTVGVTNRANAHPFTHGHITGVHNGTLLKGSIEALEKGLDERFGTDSETIYAHMAKHGVDKTVPLLEGAWTLVWFDENEGTLNMLKNSERPLYTCTSKLSGKTKLVWASDYRMIYAARVMADGKDILDIDEEGFGYFPMPDDTLHSYNVEDLLKGVVSATTRELKGVPVKPKVIGFTPSTTTSTTTATQTKPKDPVKVIDEETSYEIVVTEEEDGHYFGGRVTKKEWDEIASYGCSFCGADVSPEDEGITFYRPEQIVLCGSCSEHRVTTIYEGNALTTA